MKIFKDIYCVYYSWYYSFAWHFKRPNKLQKMVLESIGGILLSSVALYIIVGLYSSDVPTGGEYYLRLVAIISGAVLSFIVMGATIWQICATTVLWSKQYQIFSATAEKMLVAEVMEAQMKRMDAI